MEMLQWYFHKFGKSYKSGTYKGLDISFGRKEENLYGGILLRTIQDISSLKFYEGSCNLVKELFKLSESEEVKDFIRINEQFSKENIHKIMDISNLESIKSDSNANALTLVELTGEKKGIWSSRDIYCSPRVGLTLKKDAPEKEFFLMKNYRFCTNPEVIKKSKSQIYVGLIGQGNYMNLNHSL